MGGGRRQINRHGHQPQSEAAAALVRHQEAYGSWIQRQLEELGKVLLSQDADLPASAAQKAAKATDLE